MQKLVLILKASRPISKSTSFTPICFLNKIGKVLELIIYNPIYPIIYSSGYLSNRQFGRLVQRLVLPKHFLSRAFVEGKHCVLLSLDIKNALNFAIWTRISEILMVA